MTSIYSLNAGPDPIKLFLAPIEATLKFQPIREATIGHQTDMISQILDFAGKELSWLY